ncbi:hypothetical protein [Oceanivirga salmonicida]|uniref:hypothetical protein n=1 Tax=Oceanivirga salmonicida TaxID=1769291 RepID=UPI000832E570|nr:hypothetical protein [Oceanivirga salmonicida]
MNKIEIFWEWFIENEKKYYENIENNEIKQNLFKDLSKRLKKINEGLFFEFSRIENNKIEFSISADGMKENFPVVIELVENAPKLENFKISAFRQRRKTENIKISYAGIEMSYDDIYFRYAIDEDGLGLELNIRNFEKDNNAIYNAVYVLLDHLLGEYDVAVNISWINWVKLDEKNIDNLIPSLELVRVVDYYKETKNKEEK